MISVTELGVRITAAGVNWLMAGANVVLYLSASDYDSKGIQRKSLKLVFLLFAALNVATGVYIAFS